MNYYILAAKKDIGCPASLVELAILYDRFYEAKVARKTEHGLLYPWYARNKKGMRSLADDSVLIAKCRLIDFDIRKLISNIFIVSENFVELMTKVGLKFQDLREIEVVSSLGEVISKKKYFAAIFENSNTFDLNLHIDKDLSKTEKDIDNRIYFKNIYIKNNGLPDLFSFSGMNPTQNFLFCTENFKFAAEAGGIKGVEWMLSSQINWPDNPMVQSLRDPGSLFIQI